MKKDGDRDDEADDQDPSDARDPDQCALPECPVRLAGSAYPRCKFTSVRGGASACALNHLNGQTLGTIIIVVDHRVLRPVHGPIVFQRKIALLASDGFVRLFHTRRDYARGQFVFAGLTTSAVLTLALGTKDVFLQWGHLASNGSATVSTANWPLATKSPAACPQAGQITYSNFTKVLRSSLSSTLGVPRRKSRAKGPHGFHPNRVGKRAWVRIAAIMPHGSAVVPHTCATVKRASVNSNGTARLNGILEEQG